MLPGSQEAASDLFSPQVLAMSESQPGVCTNGIDLNSSRYQAREQAAAMAPKRGPSSIAVPVDSCSPCAGPRTYATALRSRAIQSEVAMNRQSNRPWAANVSIVG